MINVDNRTIRSGSYKNKLIFFPILFLILVLIGCGSGGGNGGNSNGGGGAKKDKWAGVTSDGKAVTFSVSGNQILDFVIGVCLSGGSGGFGCFEQALDFSLSMNGSSFSYSSTNFDVNGAMNGSTCTGNWKYRDGVMGYGSGTWTATYPAPPSVNLSPDKGDFEGQVTNLTDQTIEFTLTNNGGETATGTISMTGDDKNEFEIANGGGAFSLPDAESIKINVRFKPTSLGEKKATLFVDGSGPTNDTNAELKGEGVGPIFSVNPQKQEVSAGSGSTSFEVKGISYETVFWNSEKDPADTWFTITEGSSGTDSGTISVSYDANTGFFRSAWIVVTPQVNTNTPQNIELVQAGGRPEFNITAEDPSGENTDFGASVSISGDLAVIGDPGTRPGTAYIYREAVNGWVQEAKLSVGSASSDDKFGDSVSISGDHVIIGAYQSGTTGSAYIFKYTAGNWVQVAKLTPGSTATSRFGTSVSLSSEYAVVGSPSTSFEVDIKKSDVAFVFKKPAGGWTDMTETARLTPGAPMKKHQGFGTSVDISGDYVILGSSVADRGTETTSRYTGAAYIFKKPAGGWTDMNETAKLSASNGKTNDWFGTSVGISGDTAIAGTRKAGAAYIFVRPDGGWSDMTETAQLKPAIPSFNSKFGEMVSIHGDYALAGALGGNNNSPSALLFHKPLGGWTNMNETAKFPQYLKSLCISSEHAIVGGSSEGVYIY